MTTVTTVSTAEFAALLRSRDIRIWADGDRLRCNAPRGVLTPELQSELSRRKAELLAFLRAGGGGGVDGAGIDSAPRLVPLARDRDFPLSYPQQRLWLLDQLEPGSAVYCVPGALRCEGELDVAALERALGEIVLRHEALRTTFHEVDGQPVQRVGKPEPFSLPIVDMQPIPDSAREDAARAWMEEEAARPFDLSRGPLFRFGLLRLSAREHLLLAVTHHIVSDGWSIGVFARELAALYRAFLAGRPAALPELVIQYADFAHWQRQLLQGPALQDLLGYWRQQLGGDLPALELPIDHARPAVQSYRGASLSVRFPEELHQALVSLSRSQGVTLFMTLLAAFKALLYRYTSQEDIVVGTPVANRDRVEIEGLIGFFVNMLALRTGLTGDLTFNELLRRVRDVALGAFSHRDMPFELLVESLQPKRDTSRSPIFQVLFVLQNAPWEPVDLTDLTMTPTQLDNYTSKYDLSLYVWERSEGLVVYCEYSTDLFEAATITRMMNHFRVLLEGIVADPGRQLSDLPLLADAERRQLLVDWNASRVDVAAVESLAGRCTHHLIEEQVDRTPDAVAAVFGAPGDPRGMQQMTYRELDSRANQLARYLRRLGVGSESLVGIYVERSLDMIVGLLGILKAGGAYVPLDPIYPRERLAYMLEDAQVDVLLTQERLAGQIEGRQRHTVCLDRDWEAIAQESAERFDSGVTPEQRAYVIYTSGSTGRPKGVQIVHSALVNFLASMRQEPGLTPEDRLLAVTTLSFDIAGLELYLPLTAGAQVIVADNATTMDGQKLAETIDAFGITVMQATPATWQMLLRAGWQGSERLMVLCGGEALTRELAGRLLERGRAVWNLYGPTETTVWSAVQRVEPGEGAVPIGHPIARTQLYVLDRRLQPVPAGVPGELYIGGAGLARGYLGRPELTAEKFIRDPFAPDPGARMYRTGDLARFMPDGSVECLGRVDHQVKLRGFRIELGEIEATLVQHPAVRQAVAWVREDQPGDRRLVGYLIAAQPAPSVAELRSFLKERLPDYMVPSAFVFMSALPLTPNGKVDRRALPAPDTVRPELAAAYVAPQSDLERAVASIWQEVLRVDRVGAHDNFFDLGGHSLLIVQVHGKLRERYGKDIAVADMFKYPTIRSLSQYLSDDHGKQNPLQGVNERARRQQEALRQGGRLKMADRKAE